MWTLYIGNEKIVSSDNRNVVNEHFWTHASTSSVDPMKRTLTGYFYDSDVGGYVLNTVAYRIVNE